MLRKRETKKKSLGQTIKKLFLWVLFLSFLGVSGWVLFFSDYTKIKQVEFIADKLDKKILGDISDKYRSEFWLKYGSRNNFFLFPRGSFTKELEDQFEVIREVNFKNQFPDKLVVEVEERQGIIIWCSRENCFLVDEIGLVFYMLQDNEKEQRFEEYDVVIDKSYSEVAEDWKIEKSQLVVFVYQIKKLIEEKTDLEVQREIETPSMISREIRIRTKEGWQIYFNIENDPEDQVDLLREILNVSISEEEKNHLNYIDLRIAGKAIYNASIKIENNDEGKEEENESLKEQE